jgi:uncharacterized membrane protein
MSTVPVAAPRVLLLPLALAYPVLGIAGRLTHVTVLSVAAIAALATAIFLPLLLARRAGAWIAWSLIMGGCLWLDLAGLASVVLNGVPVVIHLCLAWLFGRTLRAGRTPLIAQVIKAIEAPGRLALPGVARYARRLTGFWTVFLALQALALLVVLACAVPGGFLPALGVAPPLKIPGNWAMTYAHAGCYVVILAAFIGEYVFRRVALRHLPHGSLREFTTRMMENWPRLLHGDIDR